MGLSRLMRKAVFFDLLYLKEFKQVTYKSDFDELQFVVQLILDLTKIIGEREPSLSQLFNENLRGQRAFQRLRNKLGVIVPFERCIRIFHTYFDA